MNYSGFRVVTSCESSSSLTAEAEPVFFSDCSDKTECRVFHAAYDAKWFDGEVAKIVIQDNGKTIAERSDGAGDVVVELTSLGVHHLACIALSEDGKVLGRCVRDVTLASSVTVKSAKMRENDPTIMDVVYRVDSPFDTANVRALAFREGVRSFANVWRPQTFVDGTEANVGTGVRANEDLTLSWRVSADVGDVQLANIQMEILVEEDNFPVPMAFSVIPAVGAEKELVFSSNAPSDQEIFNALLWLYADDDKGLTLKDGVLTGDGTALARGGEMSQRTNARRFVFSRMGYELLEGEPLNYVNTMTRQKLPSGDRAYKCVDNK